MSVGTLQGAVALLAGVSLVSILQTGDWLVSTPAIHFSIFTPLQIGTRIWLSILSWAVMNRQFVGKCQKLTYLVLITYWVVG